MQALLLRFYDPCEGNITFAGEGEVTNWSHVPEVHFDVVVRHPTLLASVMEEPHWSRAPGPNSFQRHYRFKYCSRQPLGDTG